MQFCLLLLLVKLGNSFAALLRNSPSLPKKKQALTFQTYYAQHTGRGIWKWNVALDAYQRHFQQFAAKPGKMLEIGVQSGGSIHMYQAVLPQVHYYGMDINRNCLNFHDARSTIYLGDQASIPTWTHFFQAVTPDLDICIDDGGHQAHQMLTTIQQVLPRMNPGGFFLTEDIHGVNMDYLTKFFQPAAQTISGFTSERGASLQSVHMYPFVFGVQLRPAVGQHAWMAPAATANVSSLPELMAALPTHLGGVVKIVNTTWGSFFGLHVLPWFFNTFYGLYGGVVQEEPPRCLECTYALGLRKEPLDCKETNDANQCEMLATNTHLQKLVKAVHIYQDHALVEVHMSPPHIAAYRKGDVWIPYNGP